MIKDFLGNELKEGDIVLRCKFSSFTFHRIVGFTKKRIKLSCERITKNYIDFKGEKVEYLWLEDSVAFDKVNDHNSVMYINNNANTSLIKYENIRKSN